MRIVLLLACLLATAARAEPVGSEAGTPLQVAGAALGPDGVLTRQAADVMGNDGPSYTPLVIVEAPVLRGESRVTGRVEAFEVDGEAWLELAAVYADGRRLARTLDAGDLRLRGTQEARPFALAVPSTGHGAAPVRLELGVGMLGPGVVSVSELRLETGPPATLAARLPLARVGVAVALLALAAAAAGAWRGRAQARAADPGDRAGD